jgi:hypothetical protein
MVSRTASWTALVYPVSVAVTPVSLIRSMELSASRKAASCIAVPELSSISWIPKVHYRVNRGPPLVPVPSQTIPIHTTLDLPSSSWSS